MSFKKCYFFSNNFKFCAVKKDDVELKPTVKFIFLTHLISLYILLNDNHNRKNVCFCFKICRGSGVANLNFFGSAQTILTPSLV